MPRIHFVTSGCTVEFDAGTEVNILRVAVRDDCGVPYRCASGNCGTDRVLVLAGEEHLSPVRKKERDRLGDDVDAGWRLACQTYTSGDVDVAWAAAGGPPLGERAALRLREKWLAPEDAEDGAEEGTNVG
jgi:ferredoxin